MNSIQTQLKLKTGLQEEYSKNKLRLKILRIPEAQMKKMHSDIEHPGQVTRWTSNFSTGTDVDHFSPGNNEKLIK